MRNNPAYVQQYLIEDFVQIQRTVQSRRGAISAKRRSRVRRSGMRTSPHADATSGIPDRYRHHDRCAHTCFSILTTYTLNIVLSL